MNTKDRHDILAELVEYSQPQLLKEDEFTKAQFRDAAGISTQQATTRIARMVREGKIEQVGEVYFERRRQMAWRPVKQDDKKTHRKYDDIPY